jgi:flagellar biosynthesis protein FlhG
MQNNNNNNSATRVIAVTGGKGGVGKTSMALNLAIALAEQDTRITLFDADLGLANIAVLLGLHPLRNLADVIDGKCDIQDILIKGPSGIQIVPASSGVKMMSDLSPIQHHSLITAFDALSQQTESLIIDTAAGISDSVISFCSASQEILVVVCNEPASITDAYALIKVLNQEFGIDHFRVLVNMQESENDSRELFKRLVKVTEQYMDVVLRYAGSVPRDDYLKKSVQMQRPLLLAYPGAPAAVAIRNLAAKIKTWPVSQQANGRLEFFSDRLMQNMFERNKEVSNCD